MASAIDSLSATVVDDDPVEERIDGQGNSPFWNKICSALKYIVKAGADLAVSVPEMTEAMKEVEKVQENIKDEVEKMDLPTEIRSEMDELGSELKKCIRIAKVFLGHCVDMANFCLMPSVIEAIDKDLPMKVTSLLSFLDRFYGYFNTCREKMEDFDKQRDYLDNISKNFMRTHITAAKDGKTKLNTAEKDHAAHSLDHFAGLVNKMSKVALAEVTKGYIPADAAGSLVSFFTVTNIFAHMYEHKRMMDMVTDKQNITESNKSIVVAEQAKKAIAKFVKSSMEVRDFVYELWDNRLKIAYTHGKSLKEEFKDASIQLDCIAHSDIKNKLESIRRSMETIIQTLGVEGENINSALINAQSQQPAAHSTPESSPVVGGEPTLNLPNRATIGLSGRASIQVQSPGNAESQVLIPTSTPRYHHSL